MEIMLKIKSVLIFFIFFLFAFEVSIAQKKVKISGNVAGEGGEPLPAVNVFIKEYNIGASTDINGYFEFLASSEKPIVITASMIGYHTYSKKIEFEAGKDISINIILSEETIQLKETVVMGSSYSSEKDKGIVVSSLSVITTPGGAADLYQTLKTMPGITQVSESAELYVRGGDPSETVTLIDQASVYHPYTYESAYGGLFSNLNTGAIQDMYFSSGGFSVKYGNVLSGVLDVKTKNIPEKLGFSLGLSMAAASLDGEIPLIENKFGLRFYSQQSYTQPIMWMNGGLDDFTASPSSRNLTSSLVYKFSKTGQFKVTGIIADDKQGVNVNRAEFDGVFNGNSETEFINAQVIELLGKNTLLKGSLSYNRHNNNWLLGILDLNKIDESAKLRTDFEHTFSKEIQLSAGLEVENRIEKYIGTIPMEDYDLRPEAKNEVLNERIEENRLGVYFELTKLNLFGSPNLFAIAGVRSDYFEKLEILNFDERIGLGYNINEKSKIQLAFGTYHQVPDFRLYANYDGNPELKSMKALHYLFSYNLELNKNSSLRAELYHKEYSNLPLEDTLINYSNNGYGYSRGLDFIYKGDFPFGLHGWISYGFIDTERKWMAYENETSSEFDITHNFTLILKYNIGFQWEIGANLKYATGRPYTPIIGATYVNDLGIYEPIDGEINSSRYPDYKRLDLRITHLKAISKDIFSIFYLEGINVLDIDNLFGYTYSKDYSEQQKIRSYFGRRTIVLGMVLSFN